MRYQQMVCFELARGCPYQEKHAKFCPASRIVRDTRLLTNEEIRAAIVSLYREHDFDGLIAFHWYNEPWEQHQRMKSIIELVRRATSRAKFLLWTNLSEHVATDPRQYDLRLFEQVHVTRYSDMQSGDAYKAMSNIAAHCPNIYQHSEQNDGRVEDVCPTAGTCFRPYMEMIFDASGWLRACCYDWEGKILKPMRLGDDDLKTIIKYWLEFRRSLLVRSAHGGIEMPQSAPLGCRLCGHRNGNIPALAPDIASKTALMLERNQP